MPHRHTENTTEYPNARFMSRWQPSEVQALLEQLDMSVETLAKFAGVTFRTARNWEQQGVRGTPARFLYLLTLFPDTHDHFRGYFGG